VHRRLRPEAFGGRVEVQLNQDKGRYDGILHPSLFDAKVLDRIESYNRGSVLLPMAFPEGSPTHPSYTAGHATVAGACVTILQEQSKIHNEADPYYIFRGFDGERIVVRAGGVFNSI